jgi:mannose-1-phosphate guanylyltransferase / phosphomannomutase
MKAIVMAGGEGTRLRPLTCSRPKPMVPVAGRPVLQQILALLRRNGLTDVIATLQYQPDAITRFFGDGSEYGLSLRYSTEEEPLGTAGSVRRVAEELTEPFLVISGDALTDMDLSALIRFHRERHAAVTMALARVDSPLEYGVVIAGRDGRVRRFLEKPGWSEVFSDTVNTGIYVIDPSVLTLMAPDRPYDWSKDLFPRLLAEGAPLYGWVTDSYWCDIGNLDQFLAANEAALSGQVQVSLPGRELQPGVWVGAGANIDPTARIAGPCVIGENAVVGRQAVIGDWAVIGDGCLVDAGASLKRSVVMAHTYVGRGCEVRGAVVGQGSALQAGTRLYQAAVIGDGCQLLEGCQVQPGVKIWPGKRLEAGTRLSTSLVWGARHGPRLFGASGIAGAANQEITPDLAVRLGAAFGSMMAKGETIAVARSEGPAARMIAQALESGLTASGAAVADLQSLPLPATRYAVRLTGAAGGAYVGVEESGVRLRFLDRRGIDLLPAGERKLENLLFREDTRRVPPVEVGAVTCPGHLLEDYRQALAAAVDGELIRRRRFRIVADFRNTAAAMVLPGLLAPLGCRVLALGGPHGEPLEIEGGMAGVGRVVREVGADLGVAWDAAGERIRLCDDRGAPVKGQQALVLFTFLTCAAEPGTAIAVPVTATRAIDQLADASGSRVCRTKTAVRSLMETGASEGVALAGDHRGAFALFRLLELLALVGMPFSEILGGLPAARVGRSTLPCPFDAKGKVMRRLMESCLDQPVQLVDGIKIYEGEDWVAILPDPTEPLLHLYAEPGGRLLRQYRRLLLSELEPELSPSPLASAAAGSVGHL